MNKQLARWIDSLAIDATPDLDECIAMLGTTLPWLHELASTAQDPQWHAEGNVHIHTNMVLQCLYQLLATEAAHIQGQQRQALILGTLLHDIAKPRRTKTAEIQGVLRVVSPQHETVGRSYLAFRLMALPLPFAVIWDVLGLVGEHHMPKRLVVKNAPRGEYLALSRRAPMALLYWLEVADMQGRICPDKPTQLGYLDEFRLFTEEYGVWQRPFQLDAFTHEINRESPQAQRYLTGYAKAELQADTITLATETLGRHFAHKDSHPHLVVLCGPSGIGKSRFVATYFADPSVVMVSLDEIRCALNGKRESQKNSGQVMQEAKAQLKAALRAQQTVVWDATNVRSDFRKIVCDLGRDYHALITLAVFLSPIDTIKKGNKARRFAVPEDVIDKQIDSYQFPLVDEAHEFWVIGDKADIIWRA
uniref:AAA family ATPase n=1 Tax=Thaumasiovibrio occultus TaxID=1891184 RepID=UPI000B355CCE|nr:AAA family ATPase [Thaumasiovibrio occultus]